MAEQKVEGRGGTLTITGDSYAPFGTLQGLPEPPEDRTKHRPVLIDSDQVCARYGWDHQQLNNAMAKEPGDYGLPRPINTSAVEGETTLHYARKKCIWRLQDLLGWEAKILAVAATLSKKR